MLNIHPIILEDILSIISEENIQWEKLRGKTVLITGAGGLIGSYLVYTLLCLNDVKEFGVTIVALVRNWEKIKRQFQDILGRDDLIFVRQGVEDPFSYDGEIHYIIHAASPTDPQSFVMDPVGTMKTNAFGTYNLLEYSRTTNLDGFLYISSREIYGSSPIGNDSCSETDMGVVDPISIRSCYPESKRFCETLCSCYCYQYNVPGRIVRLNHVYGPTYTFTGGRVWCDFVLSVIMNEDIPLKSDGKMLLSFTYISDAVPGIFFALLNGTEIVYNIANNSEIISVRDLAELVASLFPEKGISVSVIDSHGISGYSKIKVPFLDSTKIEMLGWKPMCSLKEGFMRTIRYGQDLCE